MRKILTSFSLVAASLAFAQVGINVDETNIASDAVFHVKNKSGEAKGVILPSVSLTAADDQTTTGGNVTKGLLVWNDGENALKPAGYYYWDGAKWTLTGNVDGGSSANIYSEDGPLEGNRVVTHDNHDLTFTTGTGEFVIDGTSRLKGGSYVNTTVVESGTSYTVLDTDYYISVSSSEANTGGQFKVYIPAASPSNKGRVLILSNRTGAANLKLLVAPNTNEQIINGSRSEYIPNNKAEWIVSDGTKWFNLINY